MGRIFEILGPLVGVSLIYRWVLVVVTLTLVVVMVVMLGSKLCWARCNSNLISDIFQMLADTSLFILAVTTLLLDTQCITLSNVAIT